MANNASATLENKPSENTLGKTLRVDEHKTPKVTLYKEEDDYTLDLFRTFWMRVPSVNLDSDSEPLRFRITVEKVPTNVERGKAISNVIIDSHNRELRPLLKQARALRRIPEEERPRKILELVSSKMSFACAENIEILSKTNPESAAWVAENVGLSSTGETAVRLSDLVRHGYGVCRHFAAVTLVLAKEAKMEGALMTNEGRSDNASDPIVLINITRTDTGEPVFKSAKVGEQVTGAHAWVELKTRKGWIPMDSSHNLVGDTPENVQMFRDANYCGLVYPDGIYTKGLPENVRLILKRPSNLYFSPGESTCDGIMEINCTKRMDKLSRFVPTSYNGDLSFRIGSDYQDRQVSVKILSIDPNPITQGE